MGLRLRQIAFVASDLDAAIAEVTAALGVHECFRDPGVAEFGLHNVLFRVGDQFLEIVSPTRPGTTAGRLLERRGGDGGYMVIVQADSFGELDRLRGRLDGLGVRVVWRHDSPKIAGTHLHPRDIGGAIVSIDATAEPGEWQWAGPSWRDTPVGEATAITGVSISATDPEAMCRRWADVFDLEPDGTRLFLDDAVIEFVPTGSRGEGLDAITVAHPNPGTSTAVGVILHRRT